MFQEFNIHELIRYIAMLLIFNGSIQNTLLNVVNRVIGLIVFNYLYKISY